MKTIIIDGWEYTTEDERKDKEFKHIETPKGWQLWTYEDCGNLHNSHRKELNLDDCWFFIQQPFDFNKEKGCVAWFYADSGGANLYCIRDPQYSYSALGVRFKRRAKELDAKTQKQIESKKKVIEEAQELIKLKEKEIMELQL